MKNITILGVITAVLIVFSSAFNAQAGTVWAPTESGEIDIQYIDFFTQYQLAIFDDSFPINNSYPHLELAMPYDTIYFEQNGSDWIIFSDSSPANTLTLKYSNHFQLALWDGTTWMEDLSPPEEKSYGMYVITWPQNITLTQIDAVPVPIPAGIYLLGVGLLACAGLKKYTIGSDKQV